MYGANWSNLRKATTFRTRKRRVGLEPPEYAVVGARRVTHEVTPLWSLYAPSLLHLAFGAFVFWHVEHGTHFKLPPGLSLLLVIIIGAVFAVRAATAQVDWRHRAFAALLALVWLPRAVWWLLGS